MLLALKERLGRLRGSTTAKLIVLEFFVVLAGVLAAQLLAGWFAEREERARAQSMVRGIGVSLHNSAELALMRSRMTLCLKDRIERVRDALARPQIDQATLAWVSVPEQNILDDPGFDAARPLLHKVYGPQATMSFNLIEFAFKSLLTAQDEELAAWQTLTLLHPANGPVDQALRAPLKLALGQAERANRLLSEVAPIMTTNTRALGTPVHQRTVAAFAKSPKLCANMVGYSEAQHDAARAQGRLPDGTVLHPRLRPASVAPAT